MNEWLSQAALRHHSSSDSGDIQGAAGGIKPEGIKSYYHDKKY